MNDTVIIYASTHHGNTEKLVKKLAEEYPLDLVNIDKDRTVDLTEYARIGIASGVAYGKYYPQILDYMKEHMPEGKRVFFIHTAGNPTAGQCAAARAIADGRSCVNLGVFCCKGYDTYGPFKLIGGIGRDHPNEEDMESAKQFYADLQ